MASKPKKKSASSSKEAKGPQLQAKPNKNNPNSFADADYWDQLNALLKNADNYRSNMGIMKSRVNEDYGVSAADLAKRRGRDLTGIREDFAARGVVKSGGYGKRVGEYEQDYSSSLSNLERAKNRSLQDISMGYNDYLEQWRLQKQQAIQDAIQRRLLKLKK